MTILFTKEVEVGPIGPGLQPVWAVVASAPYQGQAWVTSLDNGTHMTGSKHDPSADTGYHVAAVDFDCMSTEANQRLTTHLQSYLPPEYDVIMEDAGEENEHIHVEHDPTTS